MKVMFFRKPGYYFRRDPDMGWHMAFWRWRIAFQVIQSKGSAAGWTDDNKRQGRDGEVPMPEVRWELVYLFGGSGLFVACAIAGIVAWGVPFIAGLGLMAAGLGGLIVWAFEKAAPW
jgi:hypothetical protein